MTKVPRLEASTTAEELWEKAIKKHTPCVISGAFPGLAELT